MYITEQRDKSLLLDITNSIHSSNSFLPRERVFPKPMLTRARTRAFPGILNKKPSQPSHCLFKISDFRLCNTPFIILPILPPKMATKRLLSSNSIKKCPKSPCTSLDISKLQRFLWRLWKQKVRNCCSARVRARVRERFSQIVRLCLLLPFLALLQNVGEFWNFVGDNL